MKPRDKCIKIRRGKYRYRGHIIYSDTNRIWWCCPDPSDTRVFHKTLRESKQYIDDWEVAFEERRVHGNIIGVSLQVLNELCNRIEAINKYSADGIPHIKQLNSILDSL